MAELVVYDEVAEYTKKWGLTSYSNGRQMAADWLHVLRRHTDYAVSIMMPFTWNGQEGVCVLCSTKESTRMFYYNMGEYQRTGVVSVPHWFGFRVCFFEGMPMMNFRGITASRHQGRPIGRAGQVFDRVLTALGRPARLAGYTRSTGGWYFQTLRQLISIELGIMVWIEMTIGRTYLQYHGLDLYMRMNTGGMRIPKEEAWFLLNVFEYPGKRRRLEPEDWWECHALVSIGQREVIAEDVYEATEVALPQSIVSGMVHDMTQSAAGPSIGMFLANRHLFMRAAEVLRRDAIVPQRRGRM